MAVTRRPGIHSPRRAQRQLRDALGRYAKPPEPTWLDRLLRRFLRGN